MGVQPDASPHPRTRPIRPNRLALYVIGVLAFPVGLIAPALAFHRLPLIYAEVALGAILSLVALRVRWDSVRITRPTAREFLLASIGFLGGLVLIGLVWCGFYYAIYWLIALVNAIFGTDLTRAAWAYWISMPPALLFASLYQIGELRIVALALYPVSAEAGPRYLVLSSSLWSRALPRLAIYGTIAVLVAAWGINSYGGGPLPYLGFLILVFGLASALTPATVRVPSTRAPTGDKERLAEAFRSLGYDVADPPREPGVEAGAEGAEATAGSAAAPAVPLWDNLHLVAVKDHHRLAVEIRRSPDGTPLEWAAGTGVVTAAHALPPESTDPGGLPVPAQPVLVLIDTAADPSLEAFSRMQDVILVLIDTTKGGLGGRVVGGKDPSHLEAVAQRFVGEARDAEGKPAQAEAAELSRPGGAP